MLIHYPLNPATGVEDVAQLPWTNGNPATGTEGSYPSAGLMTDPQAEILNAIIGAGLSPDSADLTQLWQAIQKCDIIDTAITFTVHGAGATFSDLNVAMEYLSKKKITNNGHVTLQLAGAASGTATQYTYTVPVIIDHPNNDRISILGAAMLAAVPLTDSSYSVSGNSSGARASDGTTNIAMLRTKFATELHFTSGTGVKINGRALAQFDRLLLTGDGSAATGLGISCTGGVSGTSVVSGFALYGFGVAGLGIFNSGGASFGFGPIVSLCNGGDGVALGNSGLLSCGTLILLGNGGNGLTIGTTCSVQLDAGYFYTEGNAAFGIFCYSGTFGCSGLSALHVYKNGNYGVQNEYNGFVNIPADFGAGGNANAWSVLSQVGATTNLNGSSNLGSPSPSVNTIGNGNSINVV